MTTRELAVIAKEMRDAQRAYFKPSTRSNATLEASKAAEKRLDRAIEEVLDGPTLFGDDR